MALSIESFDTAGTANAAGVFIPVADLPGMNAAELADTEGATTKESKIALSLVTSILAAVNAANPLGLTVAQGNNSNAGPNVIGLNYTLSWSKLVDTGNDSVGNIPLPATGANAGQGGLSILDIFPNASKVEAAGAVSGAGIVIDDFGVATYGASAPTVQADDDDRKWFAALFDHLTDASVRVAGTTESAITLSAIGVIGSAAVPEAFYAATDPTSGINESDLPRLGLITRTSTLQIQVALNAADQSFDVVVA